MSISIADALSELAALTANDRVPNWDFVDHKNNITLAIDGNGLSLSDHQIVFGTQKDELISGSGVEDHLYGMGGNDRLVGDNGDDVLEGGMGNDTLVGGAGFDTYLADSGDHISDSDGQGTVKLGQNQLTFATRRKGETLYRDAAGNQYLWSGSTLTVNDSLTIDHFKNGNLSIYLDEEEDKDGGGNGGGGGGTGGNKAWQRHLP